MMETYDEPLMSLRPKNDAEKLVWERHRNSELTKENKALKLEIGVLNSEIEELKHLMKTEQTGALILKNKRLKEQIDQLISKNKKLTSEKDKLFLQVVKLNSEKL